MFNDNIKIMNNYVNYKSSLIQILVQNYLEYEYKTQNVFIYPELINDIDIFSTDLTKYQNLLNERGTIDYKLTIRAFLDEINNEDYEQSCEVKSGTLCLEPFRVRGTVNNSTNHLFDFNNLLQLITKIKYPSNTKLLLVLVPNMYEFDESKLLDVKVFEKLKNIILSDNEENKRKIFNLFRNDKSFEKRDINSVLTSLIGKSKNNLLDVHIEKLKERQDYYVETKKQLYIKENNLTNDNTYSPIVAYNKISQEYKELTDDEYISLVRNFEKLKLKILTWTSSAAQRALTELGKYPLNNYIIINLLSLY